jgi:hypothetical protein
MDLKQKLDNLAKGNELLRLLLYILFFPILAPYLFVEWFIESVKVSDEKIRFLGWRKGSFGRFIIYLVLWVASWWLLFIVLPAKATEYINETYVSKTVHLLPENSDLLSKGYLVIYGDVLAGWISREWFFRIFFYVLIIIILVMYFFLDKYHKKLIEANLVKPNWLSNILFG